MDMPCRLSSASSTTDKAWLLPDAADHRMQFALVLRGGTVVGICAQSVEHERVGVPARSFECIKVELVLAGINKYLAHFLLPRIYMWQPEAPPHFWVKYQGLDGGQLSRQGARELVRFQSVQAIAGTSN